MIGDREDKRRSEYFFGKVASFANPLLGGALSKYSAIKAESVAKAMVNECIFNGKGVARGPRVNIYAHGEIIKLASRPEDVLSR